MDLSGKHLQWMLVVLLTVAGFFSFLLMLSPMGVFYSVLLNSTKLVVCLCDHLTLFHVLDLPMYFDEREVVSDSSTHSFVFAKYRLKFMVLAEAVAGIARVMGVFFIAQTFAPASEMRDRVPKFLLCAVSYSLNLLLVILCAGGRDAHRQATPSLIVFESPEPPSLKSSLNRRG